MAEVKATLVTFNKDVYPHVKGDVVALTDEELKAVDDRAKKFDIKDVYEKGKAVKKDENEVAVEETVESNREEGDAVPKSDGDSEPAQETTVAGNTPPTPKTEVIEDANKGTITTEDLKSDEKVEKKPTRAK